MKSDYMKTRAERRQVRKKRSRESQMSENSSSTYRELLSTILCANRVTVKPESNAVTNIKHKTATVTIGVTCDLIRTIRDPRADYQFAIELKK